MTHICVVNLREKGEQLPVIAFDSAFVKTTCASGETEQKYATTVVAVDADLFLVEATDLSATGLIKFIEGFFHKHVRLRCDGEPARVALANKVKNHGGRSGEIRDDTEAQFSIQPC